jgi:hypothetical protein
MKINNPFYLKEGIVNSKISLTKIIKDLSGLFIKRNLHTLLLVETK